MHYHPKITDHSMIEASIVLNRIKRIDFNSFDTKNKVNAYKEIVQYCLQDLNFALCDEFDAKFTKVMNCADELLDKSHNIRLLSKVAAGSDMQGVAQNPSVLNVGEDSSTGTTLQVPAEVECQKKSIDSSAKYLAFILLNLNAASLVSVCNHMLNRVFIIYMSNILLLDGAIERTLDLRYIEQDINWLDIDVLSLEFAKNLQRENVDYIANHQNYWPDYYISSMEIGDFRYLCFQDNFLVTCNGGLIQGESVSMMIEKVCKQTGNPNSFKVERSAIESYLFQKGLSTVDGVTFDDSISFVCLDVDYITGIVMDDEFDDLMQVLYCKDGYILNLLPDNLIVSRTNRIKHYIDIATNRFFKDKKPSKFRPQIFNCTGGLMTDGAIDRAVDDCANGDVIYISAHKALQCTKMYDMYTTCGHYLDGHKSLDFFVNSLIESIVLKAVEGGFNCYLDNCFERLRPYVKNKIYDARYEMNLYHNNSSLFAEKDRKDMSKPSILDIANRIKKKKSLTPIYEAIKSHTDQPVQFLNAISSKWQLWDNIRIYDPSCDRNVIALFSVCSDDDVRLIRQSLNLKGVLLNTLIKLKKIKDIRLTKDFDITLLDVVFLSRSKNSDLIPILIIFDILKVIDFFQKGALYNDAESYDELVFNNMPAHVPSIDYPYDVRRNKNNFRLRNQVLNGSYLL